MTEQEKKKFISLFRLMSKKEQKQFYYMVLGAVFAAEHGKPA